MYPLLVFYSFVVLFILVLGSSFFPIPGVGILIAGYGTLTPNFSNLIGLILLILIAMIIGDITTFFLARKISRKTKKFLRKFKWYFKNELKIRRALKKDTFKWVFLSRFILIGSAPLTNYLCGFEGVKFRRFILPAMLGALVYSLEYTLAGFIFRETWKPLLSLINSSVLIAIIILIIIYLSGRKIRKQKRARKNRR